MKYLKLNVVKNLYSLGKRYVILLVTELRAQTVTSRHGSIEMRLDITNKGH